MGLIDDLRAALGSSYSIERELGAALYAVAGKADAAFYWLNHMVDVKGGFAGGIPCFDLYANLYPDPRWDAVLKRVNAVRCQR